MAYPPANQPSNVGNALVATAPKHSDRHDDIAAAINDIVGVLGADPADDQATVTAKMLALDALIAALQGAPPLHASTHKGGGSDVIDAATTLLAGLMSAADKSKLDGIEAGATADQSAAEILAALLTVDGTGSALDADLLDGQHYTDIQAYAQSLFAANDALLYRGAIDCSANPNYPAADAGHAYKVSVAGKIGGGSGPNVEVGDLLVCTVDGSLAGTHAAVGANWTIIQSNLDGAVIGPSSATDDRVVTFSGTSGRLVDESSTPTAPTATQGTDNTQLANTAYVLANALTTPTAIKTGTYAIAAGDLVKADTSGGIFTVTLPTTPANKTLCAVLLVTAGNTLTVACGGSAKFNSTSGVTSKSMATANQLLFVQYQSAGDLWLVLADPLPSLTDGTYITADTSTAGQVKPQLKDNIGAYSFQWLNGGTLELDVDYITTAALATNTYDNGTSGFGATLTATANGALTVDGSAVVAGDVLLVGMEATASRNGVYVVTNPGDGSNPYVLTRVTQVDTAAELASSILVHIAKGSLWLGHGGKTVRIRGGSFTVGTTPIFPQKLVTLGDLNHGIGRNRYCVNEDFRGFNDTAVAVTGQVVPGIPFAILFNNGGGGAGGGSVTQRESTDVVEGSIGIPTGTGTSAYCSIVGNAVAVAFSTAARWELYVRPKIPTNSDGTNTFGVKIGFMDTVDGAPANGVYFQARHGQTNWEAVCRASGVEGTPTDTGVSIGTTFRSFNIVCPGDGHAYFYSAGTLVADISSNMPSATLFVEGTILKAAGTTSRFLAFDVFAFDIPNTRAVPAP